MKEKAKFLTELPDWVGFFFTEEYPFLPEAEEKLRKPGALDRLSQLKESFAALAEWNAAALEAALKALATVHGVKAAEFVPPGACGSEREDRRAEPLSYAGGAREGARALAD